MPFAPKYLDLDSPSIREPQRGAVHAVLAHLTTAATPAQVVLPTGVGKTLVATLLPYALESRRVLVVTPARIVRDQVTYAFEKLTPAIEVGALADQTPRPAVERADRRCTAAVWTSYQTADVVIGNPTVLSSAHSGVDPIPDDLFDLVIFDEAHHLPATTWSTLHEQLAGLTTVLLTATPFRNDRRRLPGDIVYTYPLKRAVAKGFYRPVRFLPIESKNVAPADRDKVLAAATADRFRSEDHLAANSRLLVRTDRKDHALELVGIYAEAGLRVVPVLDRTAGRTVRGYLKRLANAGDDRDLDGLVAVGAMTEGFDFPNLKIAAYHRPHKTLAPTLQFVGRLARAGAVDGELVAFAEDVSGETAGLYRDDTAWETLLPAMVDSAIDEERRARSFAAGLTTTADRASVPALALSPPRSTRIFRLTEEPDWSFDPPRLGNGEVVERYLHAHDHLLAFITRHAVRPRFIKQDTLDSVEYQLHIVCWVESPGIVFISSEVASAVSALREHVARNQAVAVDASDLSKLLVAADLERAFSVGRRPITAGAATHESHRMNAGPSADRVISPSEARAWVLGHVMGRRRGAGAGSGTFGFSSNKAKLWEPEATSGLADFREWCVGHAQVLAAAAPESTAESRLSLLRMFDRLHAWPTGGSVALAPVELMTDARLLMVEQVSTDPLTLMLTPTRLSEERLRLEIGADDRTVTLELSVDGSIETTSGSAVLMDRTSGEAIDLADFFSEFPPTIFFGDGSTVFGTHIVGQAEMVEPLPREAREAWDWRGVDLSREFPANNGALSATNSVAGAVSNRLARDATWVVQDHLKNELADFIVVRDAGVVTVDLIHCKKPGGALSLRVTDIEELLAQAMRSLYLTTAGPGFWIELARRLRERNPTRIVRGEQRHVTSKLEEWQRSQPLIGWCITAVAPGIDDARLDGWSEGNALLIAAYDACRQQGAEFRLIDGTAV